MPAEIDDTPSWPAARVFAGSAVPVVVAGTTTLIVSLGLLHTPAQLVIAFAAVLLVTAVDLSVNRATGRQMPWWSAPKEG